MLGCRQNTARFLFRCIDGTKFANRLAFHETIDSRHHFGIAAGTEYTIHFRHFIHDLILIALRKAAGNQDLTHQTLRLQRSSLQDKVDGLCLR